MNYRNMGTTIFLILAVFLSYNYISPLNFGYENISKSEYTLKTENIDKANKWSQVTYKKDATYFIHPGKKEPSVAIFTFKNAQRLKLNFSIKEDSEDGDIEFSIFKNDKEINTFVVTILQINQNRDIFINVEPKDSVKIVVDKHGSTSYDWGLVNLKKRSFTIEFESFVIPFLWAMFIMFLYGKKHLLNAVNSYVLFLLILFAERLNFSATNYENTFTYMLLLFSFSFMIIFIYQELLESKRYKFISFLNYLITFSIYAIALSFIIYAFNFNHKVTKEILYAIFQSNSSESIEYIRDYISMKYILIFIGVSMSTALMLFIQERKETYKIEGSLLILIIVIFLTISLPQSDNLRLPKFLIESIDEYAKELKQFKIVQEKRKAGEIEFKARKDAKGETFIVVIGESLNKMHMGIYGYARDTTPNLSKMRDELIIFDNVYSNHTHTVPVLSFALTEANQYNNKKYYDSLSIIEVLKKANIQTYWLTNQTIYGSWDNMVSVIATLSDKIVALNSTIGTHVSAQKYDESLIDEVKKALQDKTDKTKVIFVHLMGNHSSYSSRYPDSFTKFKADEKRNDTVSYYDNSVLYNDFVVSSILEELQKQEGVNAFVYMSDHADDVERDLGHNSTSFTYAMTQIPMIYWVSDKYKERYKKRYEALLKHQHLLFSNDMFYDTLIGFFDIKSANYNDKYDLTSSKYQLKEENALVLHGKKRYADKANIYWKRKNKE